MINYNKYGFEKQLAAFDKEMSATKITGKSKTLTGSQGSAIDSINSLLKTYDNYCGCINSLFAATSGYLHKAAQNINDCEAENTIS